MFLLANSTRIMEKKFFNQTRVFSDSFKMETETVYLEDGSIRTFPMPYELGQQVTCSGGTVQMKAKVVVDADGNVSMNPYRKDSGERYRQLLKTAHGEVKETHEDVIVKLQFRKRRGRWAVCELLEDEVDEITGFLETTEEVEAWQ